MNVVSENADKRDWRLRAEGAAAERSRLRTDPKVRERFRRIVARLTVVRENVEPAVDELLAAVAEVAP